MPGGNSGSAAPPQRAALGGGRQGIGRQDVEGLEQRADLGDHLGVVAAQLGQLGRPLGRRQLAGEQKGLFGSGVLLGGH